MFTNYLKIAWRNLQRNKVYSFINIAGLRMGLACAMLIILYVKDEVSYDRFQGNLNNIYRIALPVSILMAASPLVVTQDIYRASLRSE